MPSEAFSEVVGSILIVLWLPDGHLSPGVGVVWAEVYIKHCAYPVLKTPIVSNGITDLFGYWGC